MIQEPSGEPGVGGLAQSKQFVTNVKQRERGTGMWCNFQLVRLPPESISFFLSYWCVNIARATAQAAAVVSIHPSSFLFLSLSLKALISRRLIDYDGLIPSYWRNRLPISASTTSGRRMYKKKGKRERLHDCRRRRRRPLVYRLSFSLANCYGDCRRRRRYKMDYQ